MRLSELQQALQAVCPGAVLVSPRVLERVIERVHDLHTLLWEVPHRQSCVVDRQVLFSNIEQEDLDLDPSHLLPAKVILLAQPSAEFLAEDRKIVLGEFWRRLFHASVHFELEEHFDRRDLTLDEVRNRVAAIGRAEFDEARTVLAQENYLAPNATEQAIYIEFAAVFLELYHFAHNLLPVYFPAISDPGRIRRVLTRDLDDEHVFRSTRLKHAPDPVPATDTRSDESHDYYHKLVQSAERIEQLGNTVRAGILWTRAARVAPGDLTARTRAEAEAAMQRLTRRLEAALELTMAEGAEWTQHLSELLDRADQGYRPVEADLLFDLQRVCQDHEKDVYSLNLIDWLLSAGKRPIKRPLPSQRPVRIGKHLQSARERLTRARLSDASRRRLDRLMEVAQQKAEERLRGRLRPVLSAALEDVGLLPENPPERVAFDKVIEELLDRTTLHGFLTFGDLRDALSRNQLKLPDLADPRSFVRGDPLLRLDRRLGALLDGVYRPAEIYMRGLEQLTAVNFGTKVGRWITRFITVPFGGAFVIIEAVNVLVHLVTRGFTPINLIGSLRRLLQVVRPHGDAEPPAPASPAVDEVLGGEVTLGYALGVSAIFFVIGFFLLALLRSSDLRERWRARLRAVGRGLRFVVLDLPGRILRRERIEQFMQSWPFQFFYWCMLAPLLVCVLLRLPFPWLFSTWTHATLTFLVVTVAVNQTFGRAVGDAVVQVGVRLWELLRAGLIPAIVQFVLRLFEQMVEGLEYVLFTVDEQLRFRSGDSRFLLVVRTIVAALWFPVSYVLRFYTVVLIEPMINPIKLPLSIVSAKFVYPLLYAQGWVSKGDTFWDWSSPFVPPLERFIGYAPAWFLVVGTLWLLPDAVVFLIWETKENWRLYKANREQTLQPVMIGGHGETLRGLLETGFHSGTVPKLYGKLRHAERQAARTGNWQHARYYRGQLQHVAEAVRLFVTRNLIALVKQSPTWRERALTVGAVEPASSRVRVELRHDRYPERPVWIEFELQAGWLLTSVTERGWIDALGESERRPLNTALAGLYKLAGIDLVREQVRDALPHGTHGYDLDARDLIVWTDVRHELAIRYDLTDRANRLVPRPDGTPAEAWPALDALRLIYRRMPIAWAQWTEVWQRDVSSGEHPPLIVQGGELRLIPRGHASAPSASPAERPLENGEAPDTLPGGGAPALTPLTPPRAPDDAVLAADG